MAKKPDADESKGVLSPEELQVLERQIADSGKNGVKTILNKHFAEVVKAQDKYELRDTELISANLLLNKEIAKTLKERVGQLGGSLRAALDNTALAFETRAFKSVEDALAKLRVSKFQMTRMRRIYDSERAIHRSHQSLRMALQVFMGLNVDLLAEIEKARQSQDNQAETDLLLKNAVLVYELADTIVKMLEGFQTQGRDDFLAVKKEVFDEIERSRGDDRALQQQAEGKDVAATLRDQTKQLLAARAENLRLVQQAWVDEEKRIADLEVQTGAIRRQVANLKLIRDNAKNQLGFLQILTITQMMQQNMDAVRGLLEISDIPLAPLRPEDVCRLLNIEIRGSLQAKGT